MKSNFYFLIAILLLSIHLELKAQEPTGHADYVVLISIDGFRPEFYLDQEWPAPNLKQMVKKGTYALGVRGVFPSVTYPSHTTIITGAKPARHGVFYNSIFDPSSSADSWYWETELIKVPTLWQAVRQAGKKSASFLWPVSVGGPIDYNIPEIWSVKNGYSDLGPMRENATPKGLLDKLETEVTGKLNERTYNGAYLSREDRVGEMAAYVLETYKPNLMTVHLIATDHFQHIEGRDGDKVHTALAACDRAIGKIMEAAERSGIYDNTAFIVVGDHGFVNVYSALCPNVWLVEAGLRDQKLEKNNWKATFHTSGASAFLMLKDPNDTETLQKVNKLLDSLPDKYKKLFNVIDREGLAQVGADPNAALALAPIPGISMSASATDNIALKKARGGTHGFFPNFKEIETGFVAYGKGIASRKEVQKMGLEDIAPIIAHLLELDFDAPDGVLYEGILGE